jgi:Spy/CpxP family protein refolding chaperone
MRMSESKVLLLAGFLLTLAAGAVGGMLTHRLSSDVSVPTAEQRSPLSQALDLTPEQATQMRLIWEDVRSTANDCLTSGQALSREREKAMESLLSPDQRVEYDRIKTDYNAKIDALKVRREQTFQKAVEQTRSMLTEPQRKKYEKLVHDRTGRDATQSDSNDLPTIPGPTT